MERFSGALLLVLATFFVTQPSFAMAKKELQLDILTLAATVEVAKTVAATAIEHGLGINPDPTSPNSGVFDKAQGQEVKNVVLNSVGDGDFPPRDVFKWVSKSYRSWLVGLWLQCVLGSFDAATFDDGLHLAQIAAMNIDGRGPIMRIGAEVTEVAKEALARGASIEEIGKAIAKASWVKVLKISDKISDVVRAEVGSNYLADEFDAHQVLKLLEESLKFRGFNLAVPEAQEFYKNSVSNIKQKMKAQHLVDL